MKHARFADSVLAYVICLLPANYRSFSSLNLQGWYASLCPLYANYSALSSFFSYLLLIISDTLLLTFQLVLVIVVRILKGIPVSGCRRCELTLSEHTDRQEMENICTLLGVI